MRPAGRVRPGSANHRSFGIKPDLLDLILWFVGPGPLTVCQELLDEFLCPFGRGKRPRGIALQPRALAEVRAAFPAGILAGTGQLHDESFPVPDLGGRLAVDARRGDGDIAVLQVGGEMTTVMRKSLNSFAINV